MVIKQGFMIKPFVVITSYHISVPPIRHPVHQTQHQHPHPFYSHKHIPDIFFRIRVQPSQYSGAKTPTLSHTRSSICDCKPTVYQSSSNHKLQIYAAYEILLISLCAGFDRSPNPTLLKTYMYIHVHYTIMHV